MQEFLLADAFKQGPQPAKAAEFEAADLLTALKFAAWPVPPPVRERRPAAATAALSHSSAAASASDSEDGESAEQQPQARRASSPSSCAGSAGAQPQRAERPRLAGLRRARTPDSDEPAACEDAAAAEGGRARKVRVLPAPGAAVLQRRSYTWRGITSRRAQKQQRQLEALAAQQPPQQGEEAAAGGAVSPAHSSGSAGSPAAAAAAPAPVPAAAAGPASSQKEGDREFAALTTWLRMNLHQPRTAKKAVLFVGSRCAASGRWAFRLNPTLCWGDISAETRYRLQHLPAEAAQAFRRKYPARPPEDWRLKSQKYKPPHTSQTHLVLLEDLVMGLHGVWRQHEVSTAAAAAAGDDQPAAAAPAARTAAADPAAAAAPGPALAGAAAAAGQGAAAASDGAAASAGACSAAAEAPAELDSCGSSTFQLAAPASGPAQPVLLMTA